MIEWILERVEVKDREEARAVARKLLEKNMITQISKNDSLDSPNTIFKFISTSSSQACLTHASRANSFSASTGAALVRAHQLSIAKQENAKKRTSLLTVAQSLSYDPEIKRASSDVERAPELKTKNWRQTRQFSEGLENLSVLQRRNTSTKLSVTKDPKKEEKLPLKDSSEERDKNKSNQIAKVANDIEQKTTQSV